VDRLAENHTVYAPMHPGTTPGDPEAVHELDGVYNLVVYYGELPDEPVERADVQANLIWSQACTGKFVWPIPDKGLKKRIHRMVAPTLIVWGAQDRVIPSAYASEFQGRISNSKVELIGGAGHLPHLEQPEIVANLVRSFLM
jgi:pimeloyl-ACP methyl ester carboxylesterase